MSGLYGPYPSVEEVMKRRLSLKLVTRVSPELHERVIDKNRKTGIPISEVLRRALRLWVDGKLDDLLQEAAD